MKRLLVLIFIIGLLIPVLSQAEDIDFEDQLRRLIDENARGYIGPFSTAFGTALNSGLYHSAKSHKVLGFDVGLKLSTVSIADAYKSFEFYVGTAPISGDNLGLPGQTFTVDLADVYPDRKVPTVFGESSSGSITPDPAGAEIALVNALLAADIPQAEIDLMKLAPGWNTTIALINSAAPVIATPQGLGLDMLPLPMPQVSLGLPLKSEVLLRVIPPYDAPEVGKIFFLGLGLKHNLDQWIPIPLFPFHISGQFVWQNLDVGEYLGSTHMALNVHVSKTFGIGVSFTPYVGLGWESSNISATYTIEDPGNLFDGEEISFDLDGANEYRATVGFSFKAFLFYLNADYSIGEFDVVSVGAGFTFR